MKKSVIFFMLLQIMNGFCQNQFDFNQMAITMSKKLRTIFEQYISGNPDINKECQSDLLLFLNGLEEGKIWALKMLDASSKIPSGILEGNTQDLGFFDECIGINEEIGSRNILGQYCLLKNLKPSIFFVKKPQISRAICLPSTCSITDIEVFLNQFNISDVLSYKTCQTQNTFTVDTTSWIIIAFFGCVLVLLVSSTVYDVVITCMYKQTGSTLLSAFSIITNGKKLFSVAQNNNEISCVYGIRAISAFWSLTGHVYIRWRHYATVNQIETINNFFEHKFDLMLGSTKIVDTFLLLTGLMISYTFLSTAEKFEFNLFQFYARRYLRLTPALVAVVLVEIGLVQVLSSGPNWFETFSHFRNECATEWWKTILYISNFRISTCVLPSYYLSIDMQLYILSPIILLLLRKKPKIGLCLTVCLCLCVMVSGFTVTWIYDLPANWYYLMREQKLFLYLGKYYKQTYTRAAPWFIGVIVGYIIHKTKQSKSKSVIKPWHVTLLWTVSMVILVLGATLQPESYDDSLDITLRNCFYNALVPTLWAVALAWVIFACHFGYGGIVNHFLSLPMFQVLSKLSYCNYLTHFMILLAYQGRIRSPITFSHIDIFVFLCGIFMYTQFASIILTLGFEFPMMVIEKRFCAQKPRTQPKKLLKIS